MFFKDEPTEEDYEKCISLFGNFIAKVDARLADGRAHIAGDKITSGDFVMLALVTSSYDNPNLKHARIIEALGQQLAAASNVQRVMAPMKELCAAGIAAAPKAVI